MTSAQIAETLGDPDACHEDHQDLVDDYYRALKRESTMLYKTYGDATIMPKTTTTPTKAPRPMTMDEIKALTIYAPTGSFRIDHVEEICIFDYHLLKKPGDKKGHFIAPHVGVINISQRPAQSTFWGSDGLGVIQNLIEKGYYEDQIDPLNRFSEMVEQFNAMFDDQGNIVIADES